METGLILKATLGSGPTFRLQPRITLRLRDSARGTISSGLRLHLVSGEADPSGIASPPELGTRTRIFFVMQKSAVAIL